MPAHRIRRSASLQLNIGLGGASGLGIMQTLQNFLAQLRHASRPERENHIARLDTLR